jgi:transposase
VRLLVDPGLVLTDQQVGELRAVVNSRDVSAVVATRARIVLWMAEGRRRKDVAELAGVSLPTVDRWVDRYTERGLAGLEERKRGGPREQVPARVAARILALTRTTPPVDTGLSHWSSRELAGLYRAKICVGGRELVFRGSAQAARRYSLMTPPRTRRRRTGASIAITTPGSWSGGC